MTHERAGRLVVALDLDGATDKDGLMDGCARAPDLPGWFGRNRDALADSRADHPVRPEGAVERGLLIVVDGRLPYATARPAEWETAREVFAEAVRRAPALTVALALGGSSQPRADLPG
ncbi:barstar family protein [Streptomyces sp. NBC_01635]|uniref:barstar family protein n=1 Tax=Streptomyces sp. NBC_01635 TaxID=2975904 RepID=UPI003868B558|nr:barstar family protein [Streptomyces sp. NBC_01635]